MCILSEYLSEHQGNLDPISYYNRKWRNYHMPFHSHNRLEIMYIKHGKCFVRTPQRTCRLTERDVIILRPGVPHLLEVDETCHIYNIEFVVSRTRGMLPVTDVLQEAQPGGEEHLDVFHDTTEIEPLFGGLLDELLHNGTETIIASLYFRLFLLKLLRLSESGSQNSVASGYVNKVVAYINKNYNEAFSMDDLADSLHLSKVYLHRIFRQSTGTTIVKYTNRLRIEKAKELLRTSDSPITDICFQVGINSRQYFSSMFKALEGLTPFEYKCMVLNIYCFDDRIQNDVLYEEPQPAAR